MVKGEGDHMTLKKDAASFIKVIVIGILAGSLCAALDLIPGENIWTFSSFSGSLGFWAISAMLVLMFSDTRILAGINTFIYFAFMNTSFFFVHYMLPFQFPRIPTLEDAAQQSLIWLIPSFICGIFALITYQARKDTLPGTIALSLPCGLLLYECISLYLSVFYNHKFLFQAIVDTAGLILLVVLFRKEKKKLWLAGLILLVAALLLGFIIFMNGTILYY